MVHQHLSEGRSDIGAHHYRDCSTAWGNVRCLVPQDEGNTSNRATGQEIADVLGSVADRNVVAVNTHRRARPGVERSVGSIPQANKGNISLGEEDPYGSLSYI